MTYCLLMLHDVQQEKLGRKNSMQGPNPEPHRNTVLRGEATALKVKTPEFITCENGALKQKKFKNFSCSTHCAHRR